MLLVEHGTVLAAFRLIHVAGDSITLISDAELASQTLWRHVSILTGMTVQVHRLDSTLGSAFPQPAPGGALLDEDAPERTRRLTLTDMPHGAKAQYQWTRSAMDAPPTI